MFLVNKGRKIVKLFNRTNFYCLILTETDASIMPGKRTIPTGFVRKKISSFAPGLSLILTFIRNNHELKNRRQGQISQFQRGRSG